MKKIHLLSLILVLLIHPVFAQNSSSSKNLEWKLGSQAYTFKNFTFAETLDKIRSIDILYVEAFRNQKIGNHIEGTMHYSMDENTREKVKELLKSKGVKLIAYGVVSGKNEEDWKNIFEFSKEMGIEIITSEPNSKDLDLVNRMAGEYGIQVALHNHPKHSKSNNYWHPDLVLNALKGRGNLKACADVGHWVRSGLEPVECLKKLEGHIASLHFKDLSEKSAQAYDVPWGTGISNVDGMLEELKRQNFEGLFSIEYEHNWDNSLPEVKQSVEFFRKIAKEQ